MVYDASAFTADGKWERDVVTMTAKSREYKGRLIRYPCKFSSKNVSLEHYLSRRLLLMLHNRQLMPLPFATTVR